MNCQCGNKIDGSTSAIKDGTRLCATCLLYVIYDVKTEPTKKGISMKSWKTTVGGILMGLSTIFIGMDDPAWISQAGVIMGAIGGVLLGVSARDHGVSSEDAGAHKKL